MNLLKKPATLFSLILLMVFTQSCGTGAGAGQVQDDELSAFMLGGIYFINGYGGTEGVDQMLEGYLTNSQLVDGYKSILKFPFDASQKSGIKSMFSSMWDVKDKASLLASIKDLQTREYKHKSWDYARIVNNACMGVGAEYLTKDEALKVINETLPLARKDYKDWDSYFDDFNKGRIDWNDKDPQAADFEKLAKTITKGDRSIYKILPLHPATSE